MSVSAPTPVQAQFTPSLFETQQPAIVSPGLSTADKAAPSILGGPNPEAGTAKTTAEQVAVTADLGGPLAAAQRVLGVNHVRPGDRSSFFCRNRYAFWLALGLVALFVVAAFYAVSRYECWKWRTNPVGAWLSERNEDGNLPMPRFRDAGLIGDVVVAPGSVAPGCCGGLVATRPPQPGGAPSPIGSGATREQRAPPGGIPAAQLVEHGRPLWHGAPPAYAPDIVRADEGYHPHVF